MLKYSTEEYATKKGVKALLIDVPGVPDVCVEAGFRAGRKYAIDFEHKMQVSHVIEHMIDGAANDLFTRQQMKWENERNGAYSNAYTGDNLLWLERRCARDDLPRVLNLLKHIICNGIYEEADLVRERKNIHSEMGGYLRNPGRVIGGEIGKRMGQKRLTVEESIATIDNVELVDVNEHRKKYFVAKNLRLTIAGDLKKHRAEIKDIINQFDELEGGERPEIINPEPCYAKPFTIKRKESKDIIVNLDIMSNEVLSERERAAARLMTQTMSGGFYSVLFGRIREKGLAYNPCYGMSAGDLGFCGGLDYSTSADKVLPTIDAYVEQIQKVRKGELSDELVQYCKDGMVGSFEMSNNTCGAMANLVGSSYLFLDKVRDPLVRINSIKTLTKDDVVVSVNKLFAQPAWGLCLYGNTDQQLTDQVAKKVGSLFR